MQGHIPDLAYRKSTHMNYEAPTVLEEGSRKKRLCRSHFHLHWWNGCFWIVLWPGAWVPPLVVGCLSDPPEKVYVSLVSPAKRASPQFMSMDNLFHFSYSLTDRITWTTRQLRGKKKVPAENAKKWHKLCQIDAKNIAKKIENREKMTGKVFHRPPERMPEDRPDRRPHKISEGLPDRAAERTPAVSFEPASDRESSGFLILRCMNLEF